VLYERSKRKDEGDASLGVPPSLPPELKRNVKPGTLVQDSKRLLTIEDLTNAPVISASNRAENLRSAPAMVLVLTEKDLLDRGYTELSQVLDDLPGMDVIRPSGDIYFKSYWRGARSGGGADPYLVMVDGMVFNHLFFRDGQILAAVPMSNIERVEVAYGPASAVYGPNAAMGIIHVITKDHKKRQELGEFGSWFDSRVTFGGPQGQLGSWQDATRQVDATLTHIGKDYRIRLTARSEDSVFDRSAGRFYEYTQDKYYRDAGRWTEAVPRGFPHLAGVFRSPEQKRGLDGRLFLQNAEVGVQFYSLSTGMGTRFPGDRQQTATPWTTEELSFYGRHLANLSGSVSLTSMIQYRQSNLVSPSLNLVSDEAAPQGVLLTSFEAPGSSLVLQEDLSILARRNLLIKEDALVLNLGFKYQRPVVAYRAKTLLFPFTSNDPEGGWQELGSAGDPVSDTRQRKVAEEFGTYLLTKYSFPAQNAIHLGVRYDHSSLVDVSDVTFRGGYAGTFGPLTAKALYGQAVYTPSPFDLAEAARQGRTELGVERSSTLEANLAFTVDKLSLSGDIYTISYTRPLVTDETLLSRDVSGFDLGATALLHPFRLWAYYSRYLTTKEERSIPSDGQIGDLSFNKVWGGVTLDRSPVTATVLGRWMGARDTVDSNRLGFNGLWAAFRVANLLGSRYAHPGVGAANAGVEPAVFAGGAYSGSAGGSSSIHPQPGRSFFWTLGLTL
jgi:iron complex outermembrane receptor protein